MNASPAMGRPQRNILYVTQNISETVIFQTTWLFHLSTYIFFYLTTKTPKHQAMNVGVRSVNFHPHRREYTQRLISAQTSSFSTLTKPGRPYKHQHTGVNTADVFGGVEERNVLVVVGAAATTTTNTTCYITSSPPLHVLFLPLQHLKSSHGTSATHHRFSFSSAFSLRRSESPERADLSPLNAMLSWPKLRSNNIPEQQML